MSTPYERTELVVDLAKATRAVDPGTPPPDVNGEPVTVGLADQTVAPPADAPPAAPPPVDAQHMDAPTEATPAEAQHAEAQPAEAEQGDPVAAREPDGILAALADLGERVGDVATATAELSRLRTRDTDLITRLHEDVTRLRNGEIAIALNPVVTGMIKLHDQMVSLGALSDPASPVGMLHTQLLQILELTCAIKPFTPAAGDRFDASRHTGARRLPTTDPAADGTVASTIKVGFARADGSVVRVAEVEVHRLAA